MSLQDFITKWSGKGIDFDGAYGDQCMDLMHQYCVEVLGITDGRVLAADWARHVFENFDTVFGHDLFERIPNTPTGIPQAGDIVFWGEPFGKFTDTDGEVKYAGHVAIFEVGDANKFTSFDQNFGHSYCERINHPTYLGVFGWLRFKGSASPVGDMYKGYDLSNRDSMKSAVDMLIRVLAGEFVDKSKYDQDMKGSQATIDNLNQQVRDREREILDLHGQVNSYQGEVSQLTQESITLKQQADQVPDLKANLTQAQNDRVLCLSAQTTQNKKIAQLQNTSYLTAPTTDLIREVAQRLLHIKS